MFDWLSAIFIPLLVLNALIVSLGYLCFSFHLYRIGIDERSIVKRAAQDLACLIVFLLLLSAYFCGIKLIKAFAGFLLVSVNKKSPAKQDFSSFQLTIY